MPPEFTCYPGGNISCGERAIALISTPKNFTYVVCSEHIAKVIKDMFAVDPRANIKVRNPETWHVREK